MTFTPRDENKTLHFNEQEKAAYEAKDKNYHIDFVGSVVVTWTFQTEEKRDQVYQHLIDKYCSTIFT